MSNVLQIPQPGLFGDCPYCKRNDGYLNIEKEHWFRCDQHRVKWLGAYGAFSSWKEESEAQWSQNAWKLSLYREVEPTQR